MRTLLGSFFAAVAVAASLLSPSPVVADSDVRGSRHAMPRAYSWLDDYTPTVCYTIVVVRGATRRQVIEDLGGVKRDLGVMTPRRAERFVINHTNADYVAPRVVQVERLGHAVVVYGPEQILKDEALEAMSRRGVATEFFTDVELDTYVWVARQGDVIRNFDAFFRPPRKGALPQEAGLPWGRRGQNVFANAWAFMERLSLTHISEEWFLSEHPTFVARRGALY